MQEDKPIFIRGYSRSGGTLLVTILDAHPDIAMSYELYPNLLVYENGTEVNPQYLLEIMDNSKNTKTAAKKINENKLRTFVLRCLRSELDNKDIARLLQQHIGDGQNFSDVRGR